MAESNAVFSAVPSSCPIDGLRQAVDAWKAYKINGFALVDASYAASLDMLREFTYKPLPSATGPVSQFRSLSDYEKRSWKPEDLKKHYDDNLPFYNQESMVVAMNKSNRIWLESLIEWAKEKKIQEAIISKIRVVLHSHMDTDFA